MSQTMHETALAGDLCALVGAFPAAPAPAAVAHALRAGILKMAPPDGTRLFSIGDLVKGTGLKVGVIREAIQQLQSTGLIEVRQGARGGVFMRRVGGDSLARTLDALVQSNEVPRTQVAEARREIEGLCVRLAARRATADQIEELRASIDHMGTLVTQPAEFADENIRFHMLIWQAAGNPVLTAVASALREVFFDRSLRRNYSKSVLGEALHAHDRIVTEIERGNVDRAARVMTEHINAHEENRQAHAESR